MLMAVLVMIGPMVVALGVMLPATPVYWFGVALTLMSALTENRFKWLSGKRRMICVAGVVGLSSAAALLLEFKLNLSGAAAGAIAYLVLEHVAKKGFKFSLGRQASG